MADQETRGKVKQVKGRGKEIAGILTGNEQLEREGAKQRAEGSAQERLGQVRRKVGEVVDDAAKAIKD